MIQFDDIFSTKTKTIGSIIMFILTLVWGAAIAYSQYTSLPSKVNGLERRMCAIEMNQAINETRVTAINDKLDSIDKSVKDTQKDISELKTALIRK